MYGRITNGLYALALFLPLVSILFLGAYALTEPGGAWLASLFATPAPGAFLALAALGVMVAVRRRRRRAAGWRGLERRRRAPGRGQPSPRLKV